MKRLKNVCLMIFSFILLMTNSVPVLASGSDDYFSNQYTYTVRVYSGAQGTFSDGSTEMIIQITPGTTIDLTRVLAGIQMKECKDAAGNVVENKYYAKGIRESGKDNNTVDTLVGPVYKVTKDIDLVAAYAMKGGNVSYTVKYLNADTKEELFPSQTFYGNVGEKPVVAYQFIDGYVPQAYNLAKTLVEDESENVFTFLYKPGTGGGYYYYETDGGIRYVDREGETTVEFIPGTTIYVYGGGGEVAVIPGGNANQNAGNNANVNNNANADNNANVDNDAEQNGDNAEPDDGGELVEIPSEEVPADEGPANLIDLDDDDVPLAGGLSGSGNEGGNVSGLDSNQAINPVAFIAILAGVAVIAVCTVVIFMKKKKLAKTVKQNSNQKAGDHE